MVNNFAEFKSFGRTFENIRHFHDDKTACYTLPNDQIENDRLLFQHEFITNFFNGIVIAPIETSLKEGITVLDSGCGPGVWVVDVARTYPNSTIHGIDISSVVPEERKLENTIYTTGNVTKYLPYSDNFFDYIHQRLLIFGFTRNDWHNAMKNLYRTLKPGGYIEFMEVQVTDYPNTGPLLKELTETLKKSMIAKNQIPKIRNELKDLMESAGFVNITVIKKNCSLDYETEEGRFQWENLFGVYEGIASTLVEYNENWKDLNDFDIHMSKLREEVKSMKDVHEYGVVYGQKPF